MTPNQVKQTIKEDRETLIRVFGKKWLEERDKKYPMVRREVQLKIF